MSPILRRRGATGLLIGSLALITAATLTPRPGPGSTGVWWCLACGEMGGIDFLQNVVLFVPLGAALAWRGVRGPLAVAICAGMTIAIEAAQLQWIAGRDASLGDVVANTLGGCIGWGLVAWWRRWWWPEPGAWDRSLLAAAAVVLVVAGGTEAVMPAYGSAEWYGQLVPLLGHLDQFPGSATAPLLGGRPLPYGGTPSPAAGGPVVSLDARVTTHGALVRRVAPIVSIFDRRNAEQALLGQRGSSLVFRARTGANRWRLHSVGVALPGVFTTEAATFDASGRRDGAKLVVAVTDARGRREARLRITPALGWTAWLPAEYFQGRESVTVSVSALWLATLAGPLGWFARRRLTATLAAGALVLSLGVPAVSAAIDLPGLLEWLGLLAGWAAGRGLGARFGEKVVRLVE